MKNTLKQANKEIAESGARIDAFGERFYIRNQDSTPSTPESNELGFATISEAILEAWDA